MDEFFVNYFAIVIFGAIVGLIFPAYGAAIAALAIPVALYKTINDRSERISNLKAQPVKFNQAATTGELSSLPYLSWDDVTIITQERKHGPFSSADNLRKRCNLGRGKVNKLNQLVTFEFPEEKPDKKEPKGLGRLFKKK